MAEILTRRRAYADATNTANCKCMIIALHTQIVLSDR